MNSYHISSDGVARKCYAQTEEACRVSSSYSDQDEYIENIQKHYKTQEEAQAAYEEYNINKGVAFKKLSKGQLFDNKLANIEEDVRREEIEENSRREDLKEYNDRVEAIKELQRRQRLENLRDIVDRQCENHPHLSLSHFDKEYNKAKAETLAYSMNRINTNLKKIVKNFHEISELNATDGEIDSYHSWKNTYEDHLARENELVNKAIRSVTISNFLKKQFNKEFKKDERAKVEEFKERLIEIETELENIKELDDQQNN